MDSIQYPSNQFRARAESFSTPESPATVTALTFLNSVPLYNPPPNSVRNRAPNRHSQPSYNSRLRYNYDSIDFPPILNSPPPPYPSHRPRLRSYSLIPDDDGHAEMTRNSNQYKTEATKQDEELVSATIQRLEMGPESLTLRRNFINQSQNATVGPTGKVENINVDHPSITVSSRIQDVSSIASVSAESHIQAEQTELQRVTKLPASRQVYSPSNESGDQGDPPTRAHSVEPYQLFPTQIIEENQNYLGRDDSPTLPTSTHQNSPASARIRPTLTQSWPNSSTNSQTTAYSLPRPLRKIAPLKPTTNWRQLSFLDLTHPRNLLIYLHSLELISKPLDTTGQNRRPSMSVFPSSATTTPRPLAATYMPSRPCQSYQQYSHNPLVQTTVTSSPSYIARLGLIYQPNSWLPTPVDVHISPNLRSSNPEQLAVQRETDSRFYGLSYAKALSSCRITILIRTRLAIRDSAGSPLVTTLDERISALKVKDISLELVPFGTIIGHTYNVFLNRIDRSIWILPYLDFSMQTNLGLFDTWAFEVLGIRRHCRVSGALERVVAIRWADGLDCVDEMEVKAASLSEGRKGGRIEIYLGEGVKEVEDGWVKEYLGVRDLGHGIL